MNVISIADRPVGEGQPCFIIAEISGNHRGRYEEAADLVRAAKEAGADAVKLQTYTPDTITLKSDRDWFVVSREGDRPEPWANRTLYDLYQEAHTPWEWQPRLKQLADDLGILLFSSPFDETAVDFLDEMGVPCFKVASYEAIHIPLLRKIATKGKPVMVSVGFASAKEVELALSTLRQNGVQDIAALHCVTSYAENPGPEFMNLRTIADIRQRFGVPAGFSDNNCGIRFPVAAVVAGGAKVLEKHLIVKRALGGPDATFSIEPSEFRRMVELIRRAEAGHRKEVLLEIDPGLMDVLMGNVRYGPASPQERANMVFRPSIWARTAIKEGEVLDEDNLCVRRPSPGLAPKELERLLGRKAARDIEFATPMSWDLVKP